MDISFYQWNQHGGIRSILTDRSDSTMDHKCRYCSALFHRYYSTVDLDPLGIIGINPLSTGDLDIPRKS